MQTSGIPYSEFAETEGHEVAVSEEDNCKVFTLMRRGEIIEATIVKPDASRIIIVKDEAAVLEKLGKLPKGLEVSMRNVRHLLEKEHIISDDYVVRMLAALDCAIVLN
jgi:hypothetical protein